MIDIGRQLYQRWDVIALAIAMFITFGLELLGVFGHKCVTITAITVTYVPWWLRCMIWGWLGGHFLIQHR